MRVLVTGGAGFLGINCIRYLLSKNIRDIVSLDFAEFDYPEKNLIQAYTGDIRNPGAVIDAMHGVDCVIHTAAALPLYSKHDIFTTDIDGTRNLCEAALREHVDRFIHISSTAVYGIPRHHPLYEHDRLVGVGEYGEAKIQAENVCLGFRKQGMCIPIIRPKSFIGPERLGVFALLYDWAKDGRGFPMIGNGKNRYQLLDVEDLCSAIYLCMTRPKKDVDDIFNIGAEEFGTMREDYQAVLDEAGFGKKIIGFPKWPVIGALRFLEFLKLSPLYKWVYETAHRDSFVSIEKARVKIGFTPRFSNRDALVRNFRWYLENCNSFEGQSGVSHRVPWKQGILKLVKALF